MAEKLRSLYQHRVELESPHVGNKVHAFQRAMQVT